MPDQDAILDAAINTFLAADGTTPAETSDSGEAAPESTENLAASDTPTTEDPTPEAEVSEGEPTAEVRSPKLQKLLDKYDGDEDALAEAIFQNQNSMSKFHKELEELKTTFNKPKTEATPEEIENDADVQWISGELKTLDGNLRGNEATRVALLDKIDASRSLIARLEGKIEVADDFDKAALTQQKTLQDQILQAHLSDWRGLDRDDASIRREKKDFERQLDRAKKEAAVKDANLRQRDANFEVAKEKHFRDFSSAIDAQSKSLGLSKEQREYMFNVIRSEAYSYLSGLPETRTEGINIEEFVRERSQVYARMLGVNKATILANKPSSVPNGKTVPEARQSPQLTREALIRKMPKTADEARNRARAILG